MIKNPTPLQLRRRAMSMVQKAIKQGKLPKLDGSIECSDCDAPAACYDHRNYYHPLAVDPVCTGCNNRRGPGFPLNPDGNEYKNPLGTGAGKLWSGVEPSPRPEAKRDFNQPADTASGPIDLDDDVITWDTDWDKFKAYQEIWTRSSGRYRTSFLRGLYDWYGVEPL